MGFITGLPPSNSFSMILTIVDRVSKMVHLVPEQKELSDITICEIFHLHSIPVDMVSDGGPQFISQFWKEFCNLLGISVSLSSGSHPQIPGQLERTNQDIETKLCILERLHQMFAKSSLGITLSELSYL